MKKVIEIKELEKIEEDKLRRKIEQIKRDGREKVRGRECCILCITMSFYIKCKT